MTKRSKITQQEKYIIQGMLNENKDIKEIAKSLNRSIVGVQEYIDKDLDKILGHVVDAKLQRTKKDLQEAQNATLEAQKKIQALTKELAENPGINNPQLLTVQDKMIRETENKISPVSVMTQAASEHADENRQKGTRITRGLYHIKEQEIK